MNKTFKPVKANATPVRLRQSRVVDLACDTFAAKMLNTKTGKKGLSPSYLATQSGVSTSTLYRLRDNGRKPYSPHLKTIEFAMKTLGFKLALVREDE